MKYFTLICIGLFSLMFVYGQTDKSPLPARPLTPRLLSGYVTKRGNITLQLDALGYYAYVDLSDHYSDASDSSANDPAMIPVSVYLYSSETFLVSSCLDFFSVDCTVHECDQFSFMTNNFTLPYYSVQGYYAMAFIYLDYSSWQMVDMATIATSCSSNINIQYGNSRYGVVGLGLDDSYSNFFDSPAVFTVSVNIHQNTAQLLFESDTAKISSSSFVAQLSTNADWQVENATVTITLYNSVIGFTSSLLFDWDADAIGLPSDVYPDVISYIGDSQSMICDNLKYKPTCPYSGKLGDLPTIKLTIQSQEIDLPPALYVEGMDPSDVNDEVNGITLNLKEISSSLTGQSYVTPDYENYVILDRHFLSYYFAEFKGSDSSYTITLYTEHNNKEGATWPIIVGGVIGFVILIGIIICCVKARKGRLQAAANNRIFPDDLANHSQGNPLLVNNQRA